jgi:hypothetical protein
MPHQPGKLGSAFTKGRIAKSLLDHPATEPRVSLTHDPTGLASC